MWARTVHGTGQPVLPDSLDDDDMQVVYDAPEQPLAEDDDVSALVSEVAVLQPLISPTAFKPSQVKT